MRDQGIDIGGERRRIEAHAAGCLALMGDPIGGGIDGEGIVTAILIVQHFAQCETGGCAVEQIRPFAVHQGEQRCFFFGVNFWRGAEEGEVPMRFRAVRVNFQRGVEAGARRLKPPQAALAPTQGQPAGNMAPFQSHGLFQYGYGGRDVAGMIE